MNSEATQSCYPRVLGLGMVHGWLEDRRISRLRLSSILAASANRGIGFQPVALKMTGWKPIPHNIMGGMPMPLCDWPTVVSELRRLQLWLALRHRGG